MTLRARTSGRNLTVQERLAVGASAASAVKTLVIDLGAKHTFDRLVAAKRGAASTGETLLIEQSHNGSAQSPTWETCPNRAGDGLVTSPASAANMVVSATPTARWVRVSHTNGSTAQTALLLDLAAFSS